jgi:hypothetical protein
VADFCALVFRHRRCLRWNCGRFVAVYARSLDGQLAVPQSATQPRKTLLKWPRLTEDDEAEPDGRKRVAVSFHNSTDYPRTVWITLLLDQPLIHPLARVALLARGTAVRFQPAVAEMRPPPTEQVVVWTDWGKRACYGQASPIALQSL